MSRYKTFGQGDDAETAAGDGVFRGVNNRLNPEELQAGALVLTENVRLRDGSVTTRLGVSKPPWLNVVSEATPTVVGAVTTFYGVGQWKDPNGKEWLLIAADGKVWRHCPDNVRVEVALPTGVRVREACTFCGAFDRVYLFRGRWQPPLVMTDIDSGFKDLIPRWNATTTYRSADLSTGTPADEVAYGPALTLTTLTSVGTTATAVTASEHGYVNGNDVVIRGATPPAYNGRYTVTVVDATTFTYEFAGNPNAATGATASADAMYWQAYGSVIEDVSLTMASGTTVVTATIAAGHGLTVGDYITIRDGVNTDSSRTAALNGKWKISAATKTTFTFDLVYPLWVTAVTIDIYVESVVTTGTAPNLDTGTWLRLYNVLPNADEGVFVNNRVLVPTAWTPGTADYDGTSGWTKKDFLVILDVLDPVHFSFYNELRINQGASDEITQVLKYNQDTVVVLKGASWGVLTGLTGSDLTSTLALDMRADGYGSCGPRAGVVTGKNVVFAAPGRGICGLAQNQLGQTRGVDVPLSNDFDGVIRRINWDAGDQIRLEKWNDRLYCAVPLDGAAENNAILVYDCRGVPGSQSQAEDYAGGQWESVDTGAELGVQEWFHCTVAGRERLGFIGRNGYAALMEECWGGDQLAAGSSAAYVPIAWKAVSRGYAFGGNAAKKFKRLELTLSVWAAAFRMSLNTAAAGTAAAGTEGGLTTPSRTKYLKPVGRPDYEEGNTNADWEDPGRGDYSVALVAGGVAEGFATGQFQEIRLATMVRTLAGRYAQWTLEGTGRVKISAVELSASDGQRRCGINI